MKNPVGESKVYEMQIPLSDFLKSFNKNMPEGFPRASSALLKKFKDANSKLFVNGDMWCLDRHRKKIVDWLSQNRSVG